MGGRWGPCVHDVGMRWQAGPGPQAARVNNRWAAIAAAVRWPDSSAPGCGRRPKPGVTSKEDTFDFYLLAVTRGYSRLLAVMQV